MLSIEAAIKIAESLIDALPTQAVEVGFGDYNKNGTPDVLLRVVLDSGKPIEFGPIDVPVADLGGLLAKAAGLLG